MKYHPIGILIKHWDTIKEFFTNLWDRVKQIFSGAMNTIKDYVTDKFNAVVKFLTGIRDKIVDVFQRVKDKVLDIWDGIVSGIKGFVNRIIDAINSMIRGMNRLKWDVPDWVPLIGGKKFGISIPIIPRLHSGTDYFMPPGGAREGLALLERGEQVISRDQAGKARELNININFTGLPAGTDEESIKQFLLRALREPDVARRVDEATHISTRGRLAPQGGI